MVENVRKRIGVTTLQYQKLEDLIEAIGLSRERVCTHCWEGKSSF
jgi:amidophosphoribosyltransferase